MMHGVTNIVFVVLAGLGALLVAIPLPKALASGNVGTSMLIVWTELACLVQFANAIRWNRNIENWAPGWCDFCGYFFIAVDVALAASGVSINRRLYMIVTLNPRAHEKVLNMVVDLVLCLVVPCASIALEYIVQQYRFYIYEDIGCLPGVGGVNLAFPLVWMLPLLVGTVAAGYACLTIRANFRRNHRMMGEPGVNSTWSRRLMAIGVISTLYGLVPTSISIVSLATAYPVTPWPGWRAIHSTIDVIVYVPAQEWQSSSIQIASVELRRWTTVTIAFIVFLILGLTTDMKRMYGAPFRSVIEQAFSIDQESSKAVLGRNTDGALNDQKAPRLSRFRRSFGFITLGKPREARRQEGLGLIDRPRLNSDFAGSELVFPVSRPSAAAHLTYPSWQSHYEKGGYPVYT